MIVNNTYVLIIIVTYSVIIPHTVSIDTIFSLKILIDMKNVEIEIRPYTVAAYRQRKAK